MKKNIILLILCLLIVAGCTSHKQAADKAPLLNMELFLRILKKVASIFRLIGQYYSFLSDYKGKMNIFVQKVTGGDPVQVTTDTLRSIYNYLWKGNRIVYLQDVGGDENFQLFSISVTGDDLKALTPFPGHRTYIIDILRFVPGREKELIIQINKRDKEYFDPYMINIETGKLTLLLITGKIMIHGLLTTTVL